MEKIESKEKYFYRKIETIKYQIIVKIPGDSYRYMEEFYDYDKALSRYWELETDARNLLLSLNEIQSITKVCRWNEP
jgi:hypothetical protein